MIRTLGSVTDQVLAEIREEMGIRRTEEVFLLFALGSQFDHLIKQRMEKLGVFCLVADPSNVTCADVQKVGPKGIILSGGPVSVYNDPPPFDSNIFDLGIPVLGICLGFQLWAQYADHNCRVTCSGKKEFGRYELLLRKENVPLFTNIPLASFVLQSHGDRVENFLELGDKSEVFASTENTPIAAARWRHLFGVQFHPEVTDTDYGQQIFENFCFKVCGATARYPARQVATEKFYQLSEAIGDKKVLLALSGGSDSSTVAYLLRNVMPDKTRLRGVYIKGIDRPEDESHVREFFNRPWIDLRIVDATERFLIALSDIKDSHQKRVAMRGVYKDILEEQAKEFGASFIAQGTLYTDISESGGGYDTSSVRKARIKLHHNVDLGFSVQELLPLSDQVKDTGRDIGRSIGVPEVLLTRHPFPGPGLVVRIEGEVTREKLEAARKLDAIFIEELYRAELYEKVWQAGVTITASIATCTKGDDAATGWVVCPWAFWSVNGFTAQAVEFSWGFMKRINRRMTGEVPQVGRVTFSATDKPPATIEWE